MGCTMQFVLEHNVVFQSGKNFLWAIVFLTCFNITEELSTAKRRCGVVSIFNVHWLRAKDKMSESQYNLTLLTGSLGKQRVWVAVISKGSAIMFPSAHT